VHRASCFCKVLHYLEGKSALFWLLFGLALPEHEEESPIHAVLSRWETVRPGLHCACLLELTEARNGCLRCLHACGHPEDENYKITKFKMLGEKSAFRIRDILVQIRKRILGSTPLTNRSGSGSGSCSFHQ
jgi:hypothetical protein